MVRLDVRHAGHAVDAHARTNLARAAAAFIGMWTVMMMAMMLPVLMPMLSRYRRAVNRPGVRQERLTVIVCLGYFSVWILLGALAFPLGVALAAAEMLSSALSRAVPLIAGLVVAAAGALQLTRWKAPPARLLP